jgi:hypothetical protein
MIFLKNWNKYFMSISSKFMDFFARSVCAVLLTSFIPLFAADPPKNSVPTKVKPATTIEVRPAAAAAIEAPTPSQPILVAPLLPNTQSAVNVQVQAEESAPVAIVPVPSVTVNGVLGVFDFTLTLPRGWSVSTGARAKKALEADGNYMTPSFSFEGPNGGIIYGTWKIYDGGLIFTPESIAADNPGFPSGWGVKKEDIRSFVSKAGPIDYAVMTASGPGDGLLFSASSDKRMFAVWVDIPLAYKDKTDERSAWASLYYRGPAEGYAEAKTIYDSIMAGLRPNGVVLLNLAEYRRNYAAKNKTSAAIPAVSQITETNKPLDTSRDVAAAKKIPESEKTVERPEKLAEDQKKVLEVQKKVFDDQKKVFDDQRKVFDDQKKVVEDQKKGLEELKKVFDDQRKVVEDQKKVFEDQKKVFEDQKKGLEELKRVLEDQRKVLARMEKNVPPRTLLDMIKGD